LEKDRFFTMDNTHSDAPAARPNASSGGQHVLRAVLVVGDIISFLIFAALGRSSHSETTQFMEVAGVAAPFVVGWFAMAPLLGAYRLPGPRPAEGAGRVLPASFVARTALAWLVAWPLGLLLRGLLLQRGIPLTFALITGVTNLLLLCGWRGIFAWLATRRR
jgi:hypothetical protein